MLDHKGLKSSSVLLSSLLRSAQGGMKLSRTQIGAYLDLVSGVRRKAEESCPRPDGRSDHGLFSLIALLFTPPTVPCSYMQHPAPPWASRCHWIQDHPTSRDAPSLAQLVPCLPSSMST
ncbi:hypothetical protein AVEN_29554-1 [Araneus ventricosus]|uniref:Uncharacterized protein n=1 Tax=Araneus ventricosus TaxID=182803 RepID=A0A4Y2N8V3_ARAVE|nr:hypothetical protein AVEN_29554-1 [Araneus ventricosus]